MSRLARAIAVTASAYFAFWACAPSISMPPPVPFAADQRREVGAAGMLGQTFPYPEADLPWGVKVWGVWKLGERTDLGGVMGAGYPGFYSAGLMFRYFPVQNERFRLGVQAEGGYAWASLGVPVAYAVTPRLWLYTEPELGASMSGPLSVPLGVSYSAGEHVQLDLEVGVISLLQSERFGYLGQPAAYGSLGVGYRF